jgi:23S rRNA (adenine2503-C2)-methyltransferase
MKVLKDVVVPTGNIYIAEGEKGMPLEYLSIGDYGKDKNIKADFLGLHEEINGVTHSELLPLTENG